MAIVKDLTIVRLRGHLLNYSRMHIDSRSIDLFYRCIPAKTPKSDYRNSIINLLDCYLGITGQSITYLSLSEKPAIPLIQGFVGALISPNFLDASDITKEAYRVAFNVTLVKISLEIPNMAFEVDRKLALELWNRMTIDPYWLEYYKGWYLKDKNHNQSGLIKLAWIWNNLGSDVARDLHQAALRYSTRYELKSKGNFLPILNNFIYYLEKYHSDLVIEKLRNFVFTSTAIEGFCRNFFESKVDSGNCLETTIKRWNDALPFIESVLFDSGVFARPFKKLPYIEPSRKIGAETKISKKKDGVFVKDKLIVEVPLSMTDDEVIKLLFKKIATSVSHVLVWASAQAQDIISRCLANGSQFEYMDFDLDSPHIKSKYRKTQLKQAKTEEISYRFGLPTSYSLEPFIYLLINEHPLITESFLLSLKLYDKAGKFVGLERTDGCSYLIGYKRRKGGKLSQQKVALNEKSLSYVEQVIILTQPLRNYLVAKNDDNYRYMFLTCITGFSRPSPITSVLSVHNDKSAAFKNRLKQFRQVIGESEDQELHHLVSNLSPTKFRATKGLQVYLDTGSAKAMSEALGHTKYKPELLSHYLPEPILAFFQSRWIRIFQKGIICESMKDSSMLLQASNFNSIEDLDKFLKSHVFSLPNIAHEVPKTKSMAAKEIYISVDDNILTALLSIKLAVESTDPYKINEKASYWSKFSSLLEIEIEKNSYDTELILALDLARNKADPNLMQNMILQTSQPADFVEIH